MIPFTIINPKLHPEALGIIPMFLDVNDPRPAKEQIDANYSHGGGWDPLRNCSEVPGQLYAWAFPGDPPYKPLAIAKLRQEVIVFYNYAFVGIWQRDGSFEISRMD